MLTGRQIRAARGLLGWDASDLAEKAGLTRATVGRIELGSVQPQEKTIDCIEKALRLHGVEFTEHEGVRFKTDAIEVFEGAERFQDFTEFLYNHLKQHGGDVCLSTVDENLFAKYRSDPELHRKRMKDLVDSGKVTFRILAGESKFTSSYAKYRKLPRTQNAAPTSFYAFGNCLALISFDHVPAPYVVLHKSGPFAEAFRQSFKHAWDHAEPLERENVK